MDKIDFTAGAGFGSPTGSAGNNLEAGGKVEFRGGYKVSLHFVAALDVQRQPWGFEPEGTSDLRRARRLCRVWTYAFQPVRVLQRRSPANAEIMAGAAGAYRRRPVVLRSAPSSPPLSAGGLFGVSEGKAWVFDSS